MFPYELTRYVQIFTLLKIVVFKCLLRGKYIQNVAVFVLDANFQTVSWGTLRPEENVDRFADDNFKYILLVQNVCFDWNFTEVCSLVSNWQKSSIGSATFVESIPEPMLNLFNDWKPVVVMMPTFIVTDGTVGCHNDMCHQCRQSWHYGIFRFSVYVSNLGTVRFTRAICLFLSVT